MGKAILTFICMFLSLAFGFDSYASEHLIPMEEGEYQEIVSMRDEILFQMNHGGARAELGRDVRMDELGMERAYKIYSEPGLLKTEDPKKSLENSDYMWQIPVYTDHVTVLADITKVTPLPKDIPEDAEEMLKDDLNHWTVGAVYVYKNESFPDFPGSDIPQQSYSVQMEPPSLSFQFRKPRHMHLPESGRRRQKTGVQYHLWRYRMAAMTAEPASRFIITAMLPEHQTPGFGTGWAFPIKREALEPGTYRLSYWELPELSP